MVYRSRTQGIARQPSWGFGNFAKSGTSGCWRSRLSMKLTNAPDVAAVHGLHVEITRIIFRDL